MIDFYPNWPKTIRFLCFNNEMNCMHLSIACEESGFHFSKAAAKMFFCGAKKLHFALLLSHLVVDNCSELDCTSEMMDRFCVTQQLD